jgi:glycosyltransferase involved in cell wall biosynthesis
MPERDEYHKQALDWYSRVKGLNVVHIPFHAPQLHPSVLSQCDFDIGLAPLSDCEFNKGKSCIKFYEYASVGTPTLASDIMPYKEEVNYRVKNNTKDWVKKLEKLISDKSFREKLTKKQKDWVMENRTLKQVGVDWELALQKPGGLKVKMQEK